MLHGREHARGFRAGGDVAGVLVLQADRDASAFGFRGEAVQRRRHLVETARGIGRAPVREYPDDRRLQLRGDRERAVGQSR